MIAATLTKRTLRQALENAYSDPCYRFMWVMVGAALIVACV